jgi:GDPmannose 4,6-dehydratase
MKAIIIGCNGQDGSYLWEQLSEQGFSLVGIASKGQTKALHAISPTPVDILDYAAVGKLMQDFMPDQIYYLATHHHSSQDCELLSSPDKLLQSSLNTHLIGLNNVLHSMKISATTATLAYAASSKVFGEPPDEIQTEAVPFSPLCIYGITKAAGVNLCRMYRKEYGMRTSCVILYNHESPRRAEKFVSQKVVHGLVKVKRGLLDRLELGSLAAAADWGYAPDYTRAMQMISESAPPDEYIVATGQLHTVDQMARLVCKRLSLDPEKVIVEKPGILFRQSKPLCGDASKLRDATGWKPDISFEQMIDLMVDEAQNSYA